MSRDSVILLVEEDTKHAYLIAQAMNGLGLPTPVYAPTGEAAVLWAGAHECDLCLLNYQLPGINGLETVVRLHQRKPDLPVIMMSDAKSEDVAVAAFHSGVIDYVPKTRGYHNAVAQLVRKVVRPQTSQHPSVAAVTAGIPDELMRPTYSNRLRVIGRQLDLYGYRSINLSEVGGGFLVRALPPGSRIPEGLEFPDRDFPQQVSSAIAARGERSRPRSTTTLLPCGYEDFLRALGHHLDRRLAQAITVTELESFIAVSGVAKTDGRGHTSIEPFQELLQPEDIAYLLAEEYQRRSRTGLVSARIPGGK